MTSWILKHPVPPSPKMRLFCLPYAGGGASAYRPWCEGMAPDIEVVPIQPPGRETRLREKPFSSFGPLLEQLTPIVGGLTDLPYALFGHSKGGHLAFELARALRRAGYPQPRHLFVSSRQATHLPPQAPLMGGMSDDELLATIQMRYGMGVSVDDPELYRMMLPVIRADIVATETWPPAPEAPFDFPISALGGIDDVWVPIAGLQAWNIYAGAGFELKLFPGAHFYLASARPELLAYLRKTLLQE